MFNTILRTMKRRQFIQKAGGFALGSTLIPALPWQLVAQERNRFVSPNEQVNIGLIGAKGMGWSNTNSLLRLPEVNCVAICDVDQNIRNQRLGDAEKITGKKPKAYEDYRKLLEDKDVDAVVIGTPDHWHCLPMVHACALGKDVYCEKPMANSIVECDVMVKAAKKYQRVVQIGQWQRSTEHFKKAVEFIHSGKLGKIRQVKTWSYIGWKTQVPVAPDSAAPEGVNYDMWLGPAPKRPFNKNRFHFNFRWYWDYAGGLMTDWGVHLIDVAIWGMKATVPKNVMSSGGKYGFPDDAQETPDTQIAIYEYDDFLLSWDHAMGIDSANFNRNHGIAFIGNNGTLVVNRGGWEVYPEVRGKASEKHYLMEAVPKHPSTRRGLDLHTENFIECIKSRKTPACDPEIASLVAINAHMGNIAYRTGKRIYWDKEKKQFDDPEANQYLEPTYRSPWKLPTV